MLPMLRTRENLGHFLGPILGVVFGFAGTLRRSRVFHPTGVLYRGQVNSLDEKHKLYSHALVRLSWSLRNDGGRDLLGVALRLSPFSPSTPYPREQDQDLLFASFKKLWTLPGAFFTTKKDFFSNDYFTALPFTWENEESVSFKLSSTIEGFTLYKRRKTGDWLILGKIELIEKSTIDQEYLYFNPFQTGLGIHPQGFLQHLRKGAYAVSRRMRPGIHVHRRDYFPDGGNASPSSPP